MARKSNNPGGPYRKPRADIYTMLLLFTLIAIIVGCWALWLEVADYGENPLSARPVAVAGDGAKNLYRNTLPISPKRVARLTC